MKGKMKGLRVSAILLLIGIAVSFFAFLNGAALYQRYLAALYEKNTYNYMFSYDAVITDCGHGEQIMEALMECPGVVYVKNTLVFVDASDGYNGAFVKMLVQNEPLIYPVQEGTLPDTMPEKKQVVLGRNLLKYCEQRADGRYIYLEGEEWEVTGIIGSEKSDVLYAYDIMYAPELRQYYIDTMTDNGSLIVTIASNAHRLETYMAKLSETVAGLGRDSRMEYIVSENTISAGGDLTDRDFYWLISIFSAVNCIIISEFWIIRRKQEIVIRKIWGYDNFKLAGLLYRDLLKIAMTAVALVWLLQIFLVYGIHSDMGVAIDGGKLAVSVLFIAVIALVLVLLPVYKAATEMPYMNLEV